MYLLLALISSFCIVTIHGVNYERPQVPPHLRIPDEKSRPLNSSFPVTFYHDAYVDFRTTPPRLRIFALAGCVKDEDYLSVDVFYKGFRSPTKKNLKVFGDAHKANCADVEEPGTPCFYVANSFVTNLTQARSVEKILIHMDNRTVTLSVKEIDGPYSQGLTVCLQPIYYYTQWQNIILYIEAWRAQGATRFIMYYNSATRETRKVLEYYRDELGLIELRHWPSFGSLPPQLSHFYPKFDDASYSFSYFLAMNLCILDIKTTLGTVADLDEVLVPQNGTLLEYATSEMRGTNVGALSFENHYVQLEPSIYSNDFGGLANPIFLEKWGGRKFIFNTSTIDVAQVHFARSFLDPSKIEKNASTGALLHYRFNVEEFNATVVEKDFNFFPGNVWEHIQNMQETAIQIFGQNLPSVDLNLIRVLNRCIQRIQIHGGCKATSGLCKKDMDSVYDWIYDRTENTFLSGIFEQED